MAEVSPHLPTEARAELASWINRLAGSAAFRRFCQKTPLFRRKARAEGAALFDLMQGFVQSQALSALVEMDVLHILGTHPQTTQTLATQLAIPPDRLAVLLQAGAAMGLLKRRKDVFKLSTRGAAFLSMPALPALVQHHKILYEDLRDPAAFFSGATEPSLARFWPYVFGAAAATDPQQAATYSKLMADSQTLVAEEALTQISLEGVIHLMDVGGGTGAFLRAVRAYDKSLKLSLFDLPNVVEAAPLPADIQRHGGSFRDDSLPQGADMISLVRVLYDHSDETVKTLLKNVYDTLPPGGRLAIVEPMSGGKTPDPQVDVYFSIYTLAMETGRTRSAEQISILLKDIGFEKISARKPQRAFITSTVEARKSNT